MLDATKPSASVSDVLIAEGAQPGGTLTPYGRELLVNAPFPAIRIAEGATLLDYPTAERPYHRITINGWTKTYSGPFNGTAHLKAHSGMIWSGERQIKQGGRTMYTVTVEGKTPVQPIAKTPDYDKVIDRRGRPSDGEWVTPSEGGYELGKDGSFVDHRKQ